MQIEFMVWGHGQTMAMACCSQIVAKIVMRAVCISNVEKDINGTRMRHDRLLLSLFHYDYHDM